MDTNQILMLMMNKINELSNQVGQLSHQVSSLQEENKILKAHMVSVNPIYSEEQRREAIEEIIVANQKEEMHENNRNKLEDI